MAKQIIYEFADGTKSVVEVDDALAIEIEESRREEENYERKTRYWVKVSLDDEENYEGLWFESKEPTPLKQYEIDEEQKRVDAFLETLTETQQRRFSYRMENPLISLREIARLEHVDFKAIHKTFEQIKKKYKRIFK